jgi:hypothetical protein
VGKNIITRSLGPNPRVNVDLEGPHPLEVGDTFLLCSDGLTGQVQDAEIGAVLICLPMNEAVQVLVDLANLRGGSDNITVVTAKVLGPQIAQESKGRSTKASAHPARGSINPLLWVILCMTAATTVGFWVIGQWIPALASLGVGIVSGITALLQRYGSAIKASPSDDRHFGRGPYVSCDCSPNEEFIGKLIEIIDQLRDAAVGENWKIDWDGFNQFIARADTARASADFTSSAREYLRAISFMMAQLKSQRPG